MEYESSKKSKTYFKYIDAVYSVILKKLISGTIFKFQS